MKTSDELRAATSREVTDYFEGHEYDPALLSAYAEIVAARRMCNACRGSSGPKVPLLGTFDERPVRHYAVDGVKPEMANPWAVATSGHREFGSCRLGPWEPWQGRIDSEIVVVGQDFSSLWYYLQVEGVDDHGSTNDNLREALCHIGFAVPPVSKNVLPEQHVLLFTNSVLCMKIAGMSTEVDATCYQNCRPFLQHLIDLSPRRLVITLGLPALRSTRAIYDPGRRGVGKIGTYIEKYSTPRLTGAFFHWAAPHPSRGWTNDKCHWEALGAWLREPAQMGWSKKYLKSDVQN